MTVKVIINETLSNKGFQRVCVFYYYWKFRVA